MRLERFHIICNNAGIGQWLRPIWNFPPSIGNGYSGSMFGGSDAQGSDVRPELLKQDCECHVVNTASIAGLCHIPRPPSCPSLRLSTWSSAWKKAKARVSVLCPGFVQTQSMNSARHRPARLTEERHAGPELEAGWNAAIDSGMDPGIIADRNPIPRRRSDARA